MNDREFYDVIRKRALQSAHDAVKLLSDEGPDGQVAPHVAIERIRKIRKLARQMEALANWADLQ